jgi:hypothetical protein
MLIYKKSDKVSISIEGIDFKISPLTFHQKNELQQHMIKAVQGDMEEAMLSVRKSLRFCVKDIKGVFYMDEAGDKREYQLEFEEGQLTDDCLDELLNLPISSKLNSVCAAMLQGVPDKILDREGNEIEGIKIKKLGAKPGKSKK